MQSGAPLFPDFDRTVETLAQEWQPEIDAAIADLSPDPDLLDWLRSAGKESTTDGQQ